MTKDELLEAKDEELVSMFFDEQKAIIENDGFFDERSVERFTQSVMSCLPQRAQRLNRLWTVFCLALAIGFAIVARVWHSAIGTLQGLLADTLTNNFFSATPLSTMYLTVVAVAAIVCFGILSKERELAI